MNGGTINEVSISANVTGTDNVGGITGTAQKYDENGKIATGKYVSSFIGTYPADNPELVIIICVNEPSNGVYYGGVVAKPIGEKIFSQIFSTFFNDFR